MKAISIIPGKGEAQLKTYDEPTIKHPYEVKIQILEVGICGRTAKKCWVDERMHQKEVRTSSSATKCSVVLWKPEQR